MSQVVTELVIDADTSGADRFSAAMDKAADSTQGVSSSISGTLLAIAGIGGGMIAAVAGVRSVVDQVVSANKELADMQSMAERVGLSLKDLQAIKFGGAIAGLSDSDMNGGLEKSAQLLNDAQRNANTLSKAFEANGLSIRNANGQLISEISCCRLRRTWCGARRRRKTRSRSRRCLASPRSGFRSSSKAPAR
jgi:hypothetical protein